MLDDDLDARYVYWHLKATRERYGFDRVFRASLGNVRAEVEVIVPVEMKTGKFDLEAQREMANRMEALDKSRSAASTALGELLRGRLRVEDIAI